MKNARWCYGYRNKLIAHELSRQIANGKNKTTEYYNVFGPIVRAG